MAFDFRNAAGDTLRVSGDHWAVYLTLAQAFGWKPAGTERPKGFPENLPWAGQYATNDGQFVTDADAKLLAQVLHAAAVDPVLPKALSDVIAQVEDQVEKAGTPVPSQMRMSPPDFFKEFSPLLVFLYKGGFFIE